MSEVAGKQVRDRIEGSAREKSDIPVRVGALGLMLFLFLSWLGTAGAYLGLMLILIASVLMIPRISFEGMRHPLIIASLCYLLYLTVQTGIYSQLEPDQAGQHIKNVMQWLSLGLFVLIGWWIGRCWNYRYLLYLLVGLGLMLSILKSAPWDSCKYMFEGARCGFGFQLILAGLLFGTLLIGLLMFAPRIIGEIKWGPLITIRTLIWLLLVLMTTQLIVSSQSRAVWLILLATLPLMLAIRYWVFSNGRVKPRELYFGIGLAVVTAVGMSLVIYQNHQVIADRMDQGAVQNIGAMTSFNLDQVDSSKEYSISARAHLAKQGILHWQEKPIFGLGAGIDPQQLMAGVEIRGTNKSHFHNSYIEAMVRFGLIGLLLLVGLVVIVWFGIFSAYKRSLINRDEFYFLNTVMLLLAGWCVADYQVWKTDWRFFFYIIMGFAAACSFKVFQHARSA